MTYLEQYIKDALSDMCPDDNFYSYHSLIKDEQGNKIGCHGITCVECWNQEVEG